MCHLVSYTKVLDIPLYFLLHVFLKIRKKKKKNRARAVCGKSGGERSVEDWRMAGGANGQVVAVFHSGEFSFSFTPSYYFETSFQ